MSKYEVFEISDRHKMSLCPTKVCRYGYQINRIFLTNSEKRITMQYDATQKQKLEFYFFMDFPLYFA